MYLKKKKIIVDLLLLMIIITQMVMFNQIHYMNIKKE